MASLNTVFKKVYEEVLEPYGYKKIKGRQPYFVRMIGDEIIHLIAIAPEPVIVRRRFGIYGGAATVYRPRLNLDVTTRNNFDWLTSNFYINRDSDIYGERPDHFTGKCDFEYDKESEESLVNAMKESVFCTEQVLLKELKPVDNLKSCMDFFLNFQGITAWIIDNEELGAGCEYNEGLVNFKIFNNAEEYAEYRRKYYEEEAKSEIYMIEHGMRGGTVEESKQRHGNGIIEKAVQRDRAKFDKYMHGANHKKLLEEMERRKELNLSILRGYGINI